MNDEDFCKILKENGFDFFTGVPCSILGKIITFLTDDANFIYISATREDEAIGIAVGAYFGGKKPVVLMQNSGLGQSVNALMSLALLYKTPMLLVISWRGYQGKDEPEHFHMGKYTVDLLNLMNIPNVIAEKNVLYDQIKFLVKEMETQKIPVALILKKDVLS